MAQLARSINYSLGDGTMIQFRKVHWIDHEAMMVTSPDLFSLCRDPEETVADFWSHGWNLIFISNLND